MNLNGFIPVVMDLSLQVGGAVVLVCKVIVVWGSYTCHGHIRTVYQKDEDSRQTDHCAQQAETDNPAAAKVQLLYNEATQEGASSTSWYHHITWNEKMELKTTQCSCFLYAKSNLSKRVWH